MNLGTPLGHLEAIRNADSLSGIVRAKSDVEVLTNETFATEYEGMAWGYPTATDAWHAALSCYGMHLVNHHGVYHDNVGWIEGIRQADGLWGAYIWYLKNTIAFYSSTSMVYALSNAKTSEIACVVVGSLGVYPPQTHVTEVGPILPTNLPGPGASKDETFRADLSTYYRLVSECTWPINHGDSDGDKIPGFADGYNRDGVESPDDLSADAFQAWKLYLYNACEPTQATVRITYSSSDPAGVIVDGSNYVAAAGAFRLWVKNGNKTRNQNSFVSGDPGDYVPPGEYSAHDLGFSNRADSITMFIEPVNIATNAIILFEVDPDGTNGTKTFVTYAKIVVSVIGAELIPDFNHDREIASDDESMLISDGLFRFWINDDNDEGDKSTGNSDIPGQSEGNCKDDKVNGRCDLLDFFPVWIDLHDTLNALMPSSSIQYRLKQADSALRAVYTDLTKDQAGSFLVAEGCTYGPLFEQHSYEADTFEIPSFGVDLSTSFLAMIKNDAAKGVLLMEGASSTTSPLILEVWKDGVKILEKAMPLRIDSVEKMYRWINLRPSGGPPTSTSEPVNNPDSLSNGKNVFFLHGFNVTAEESRGWNAEIFKRLYWSGSKAKFWGMEWDGDVGLVNALHYQEDVANALYNAGFFSAAIGSIGGEKIVLAHSLGNMVVSAAIQDYGVGVDKYFMLDAAVATECYDPTAFNDAPSGNYMLNADWTGYSNKTWCAKWFELFSSPDDRVKLTWQDRFPAVLSVAYNFYSSGDEIFQVFSNGTPSAFTGGPFHLEQFAWQKQEHFKGRTIPGTGIPVLGGTDWAGWGFSGEYTMAEANAATTNDLQINPVFRQDPTTIFSSNITAQAQNDIIAQGIPALSCAAGVQSLLLPYPSRNYNANDHKPNGWGRSGGYYGTRWLHSDLKTMAYFYTYDLFNQLVSQGGLQ